MDRDMSQANATRRSKRRQQPGKAILLWFALTFVGLQLGSGLVFDHFWHAVRFKSLDHQLRKLDGLERPCDILCLGSSRTGCCLPEPVLSAALEGLSQNGAEAPCVVNLSVPVGDLLSSEHTLNLMLSRGVKPRIVVVELLPESLHQFNSKMQWVIDRQLNWVDIPRVADEVWHGGHLRTLVQSRLFPLFVHRKQFFDAIGDGIIRRLKPPHPQPLSREGRGENMSQLLLPGGRGEKGLNWEETLGIQEHLSAYELDRKVEEGLLLARQSLSQYQIGGSAAEALQRILSRCEGEGIIPYLVAVPVNTTHRQLYTGSIELSYQNYLSRCMKQYPCKFIDCRDILPDSLFLDGHHANLQGAQKFTRWFAQEGLLTVWQATIAAARE
jgi:hypothetical protein